MMCYRDRWWCQHWRDCDKAATCSRPLTDEVRAAAAAADIPIQLTDGKPECHSDNDETHLQVPSIPDGDPCP